MVSSMPTKATIAAIISAPRTPSEESRKSGNRKAPRNAPSFPAPADMPWAVVRTWVGKISAG